MKNKKNEKTTAIVAISGLAVLLLVTTIAMTPNNAIAKSRTIQSADPSLQCPNTNTATTPSTNEQQNTSHCASTSVQQSGHDQSAAPSIQQHTSND
jgi:hypothetical protein